MIKIKNITIIIFVLSFVLMVNAQEGAFEKASSSLEQKLQNSVNELNSLRQQIADEQIPLSRKLSDLESELTKVRQEYQQTTRLLDSRTLDLSNLRSEIKSRQQQATYLSNLLSEYIRNFESRLHISEIQLYEKPLETAKLAMDNSQLAQEEVYKAQTQLISVSMDRLFNMLGGATFAGKAVDESGVVKNGQFLMIGPAVVFASDDGLVTGTVQQKLGSLEPTVMSFGNELDSIATSKLVSNSSGLFPFDPTLGNAHKIEETKETLLDHIKKGGIVMIPIFTMAGAALLVAIYKLICMTLTIKKLSQKKLRTLLNAVAEHDEESIHLAVKKIHGPIGKMLKSAVEHIKEPRDLIEEVMFEKVLSTRLKLERFLPFIAISAASAPLLGLLGTVTGIINTFKMITVFGSGDVKTLSGGISEALITTEFGLIVAIPSLLIHAFLSRKAKAGVNEMEKAAVAFINQVSKTPFYKEDKNVSGISPEQMQELLEQIKSQQNANMTNGLSAVRTRYSQDSAGGIMNTRVVSVDKAATVSETIDFIRSAEIPEDVDTIFVVDSRGKYVGNVGVHQLLIRPAQAKIDSITNRNPFFVRVDACKDEVKEIFSKNNFNSVPVLNEEDQPVGRISRNANGDGSL